jgi:hypothetical protein
MVRIKKYCTIPLILEGNAIWYIDVVSVPFQDSHIDVYEFLELSLSRKDTE